MRKSLKSIYSNIISNTISFKEASFIIDKDIINQLGTPKNIVHKYIYNNENYDNLHNYKYAFFSFLLAFDLNNFEQFQIIFNQLKSSHSKNSKEHILISSFLLITLSFKLNDNFTYGSSIKISDENKYKFINLVFDETLSDIELIYEYKSLCFILGFLLAQFSHHHSNQSIDFNHIKFPLNKIHSTPHINYFYLGFKSATISSHIGFQDIFFNLLFNEVSFIINYKSISFCKNLISSISSTPNSNLEDTLKTIITLKNQFPKKFPKSLFENTSSFYDEQVTQSQSHCENETIIINTTISSPDNSQKLIEISTNLKKLESFHSDLLKLLNIPSTTSHETTLKLIENIILTKNKYENSQKIQKLL